VSASAELKSVNLHHQDIVGLAALYAPDASG
jgi:hypothetical protein